MRPPAVILISALTLLPSLAIAQEAAEREDRDIIVSAARTRLPVSALPLTVDIIGKQDLDDLVTIHGSTIEAISAVSPSFSPTRQKLTGFGESLRGRGPLFAINGVPQSTPIRNGSRDGFTIDPFFIERIELIYGSNALQGIGATGGVINQVTVGAPAADGLSGRVLLQGTAPGSFEGEALGGKAGALFGYRAGRFDASLGATFERRGAFLDARGVRIGVDGAQGEIQDSDSWSVFGRWGFGLSPTARLDIVANRFSLEGNDNYVAVDGNRATGRPATSARGSTPGVPPSNRNELLSIALTDSDLAGGAFTLQAFFNRSRDIFGGGTFGTFQDPSIAPVGTLFDQSANRSRKLGAKIAYERELVDDFTMVAGFDSLFDRTRQELILTGRAWVPETDFRSLAPFTQLNLGLFDRLVTLAGGLRWENVRLKVDDFTTLASARSTRVMGGSPSFDELLPNAGVVVEPLEGVRGYASYTKGYTVPDVGRILRAINTPGVDIDNFLDVTPVVSDNREVGVEVKRGIAEASLTYFRSSSDFGQFLVAGPDGIFDVARQRVEIEGLEIDLTIRPPVEGLALRAAYSDLAGRTDSNGDGMLDIDLDGGNIAPDRLNLGVDYTRGALAAGVQTQFYLARSYDGAPPRDDFEGYMLVNGFVRYETRLGSFTLAAQNLLDEYYITYNSDTARTADNARFFAGRGRTLTLSWGRRF